MKITNKIKIALKSLLSLQLSEIVTETATLIYDGELAVGTEVFVADAEAEDGVIVAPDGEYKAEDKIYVVAEGKIAEIKDVEEPKAEEEPVEEPKAEEEPVAMEEEPIADPIDEPATEEPKDEDRIAAIESRLAEFTEGLNQIINAIAALESRLAEVEGKVAKVEAEPAAEPIAEEPKAEELKKTKLSYLRK